MNSQNCPIKFLQRLALLPVASLLHVSHQIPNRCQGLLLLPAGQRRRWQETVGQLPSPHYLPVLGPCRRGADKWLEWKTLHLPKYDVLMLTE